MSLFKLNSEYQPSGDQPQAIAEILARLDSGERDTVLLGATGTGKTFTMANVIAKTERPALIMAHNKTLAAQLYTEMKGFFPENAVEYFVSYYDYYQPEAYVPKTGAYIEKDASINDQIDRLRHSATRALLERRDTIVISSVSCIYGLGSPELYLQMTHKMKIGDILDPMDFSRKLVELQYDRNDVAFKRGTYRVRGDVIDIHPSHLEDYAWRVSFFGDEVEEIVEFDPLTGERGRKLEEVTIYANSHYITPRPTVNQAIGKIKVELKDTVADFEANNKLIEAQRINERTQFDIEMLIETGTCKGIENYSRYLSGRAEGEPPPTLFEYLPDDALLFIDESHVTVGQIGAMYKSDRSRKINLVDYGFRMPSARDNRPLKFEEWESLRPSTIYVSATPAKYELEATGGEIAEQIIRPTGLIDPPVEIRAAEGQVDNVIGEIKKEIERGFRVLVTTLTKKMAENLSEYLDENGFKVKYLHSDIDTLERVEIINNLRRGNFDVLVGINLLREGLDIPEVGLVAILDADKTGFLRSTTSLIQTIGRAARNAEGRVILYADVMTDAINASIEETDRRRSIQVAYNEKHGITPKTILKNINDNVGLSREEKPEKGKTKQPKLSIEKLKKDMLKAASNLDFEEAARLRDVIKDIEATELGIK